ncbi:MAG: glycoside hydrolase family protein [Lachnospiraceae bacterium]|nr:glycoside hydrolase family protein [Lachnospiraceae bacterium]
MSGNKVINRLKVGEGVIALQMDGYYIWDCSVIKSGGMYHMFSSRWPKKWDFRSNWLFHSEIIHAVSESPEGPYQFQNVVFPRRGREFFDGMNTHNTCIKEYNGKFYLYYMGTTYWGDAPVVGEAFYDEFALETWNRKRIGIAVADDINGEFVRRDRPLLEPRDCTHWDCTITTNPTVAILPDGKTYMIYKSRHSVGAPLQLGVAVADSPDGAFTRLSDGPILQYENPNIHVEDPYFWYDAARKKFCLIAKDDSKNGDYGITGEWGSGFYAESDDCIHFEIADNPKVYSKKVRWKDGRETIQGNLERPSLLFDENGKPTHLFCASGNGAAPYDFSGDTYVVCMKLKG